MTGEDRDEGDSERTTGMHPDQLAFWIVAMDAGIICFSFMVFRCLCLGGRGRWAVGVGLAID